MWKRNSLRLEHGPCRGRILAEVPITRPLTSFVIVMAMLAAGCARGGETAANDAQTAADIRAVLDRYQQAVNRADEQILREMSADTERISYVNPMQRLRTWSELQGFWQGFLNNSFTQPEFTLNTVSIPSA